MSFTRIHLTLLPAALAALLAGCATPHTHVATSDPHASVVAVEQRLQELSSEYYNAAEFEQEDLELQRVSEELESQRKQREVFERENLSLRRQLAERDQLIVTYFKRLKRWERGERPMLSAPPQPTRFEASNDDRIALRQTRERLEQLTRENAKLRDALAERSRILTDRALAQQEQEKARKRSEAARMLREMDEARARAEARQSKRSAAEETQRKAAEHRAQVQREAGSVREASTLPTPAPTPAVAASRRYYLRIISLPLTRDNEHRVALIAKHLTAQGIEGVSARKSGRHWVVDIGTFASRNSQDATLLRQRIRDMRYQGRRDFRSAYFTRY